MTRPIRKYVLAAGAAALLTAQPAFAATAPSPQALDPLVALSVLGTPQSRAAVLACGAVATGGHDRPPPPGLPANQYPPRAPNYQTPGAWAYIPFLLGAIAIIALHISDDDDDREPTSP